MNSKDYDKHILTLGPLEKGGISVQVSRTDGQIVGISKDRVQFMHGGGLLDLLKTEEDKKGWQNSEIVMFPVVGPVKDYQVQIGKDTHPMDQHGISRILGFGNINVQPNMAFLTQIHDGKTLLPNPKHEKDKTRPESLDWPFRYKLNKIIYPESEEILKVRFYLKGPNKKNMPYMLGWHPAFKMHGPASEGVFYNLTNQSPVHRVTLEEVIEASNSKEGALKLEGMRDIRYMNRQAGRGISIYTTGFDHLMLWCPGKESGMFCIEPVTHIPSLEKQTKPHFTDKDTHNVLKRKEAEEYSVKIMPYTFKPYKRIF
ncbi:hypothetical protein KY348_06710 [Candidatus Woesearchaeota archaeon]|nr:hypothetical protein [Candidatus Woesearchaeota archaeon]